MRTLAAVDKLSDFLLVLDGDSRRLEARIRQAAESHPHTVRLLFLPGESSPEQWIREMLRRRVSDCAEPLGLTGAELEARRLEIDRLLAGGVKPPHVMKTALAALPRN